MAYRLKYMDSHTSHSLSSYGSHKTRIGVSPFDSTCWMMQMRMRNLMYMCNFNVSGHLNGEQAMERGREYGKKVIKYERGQGK